MLVTTLATPLGRAGAADVLRWLALLGAGCFVAASFRVGEALFGTLAGALAPLLLATRSATWGFALLGFMDPLAAALVLWALVLELRRPCRGGAVYVLLALAGLLRPEVWLFTLAYWAWCAWRDRAGAVRTLPLALIAPVAWLAWDLATTQTFYGSVKTPEVTSSAGRGLDNAPKALAKYVGGYLRPLEAVVALAGLALVVWRRERRALVPGALLALNVLAFLIVAASNGPLEQRYLLVAVALLLIAAAGAITRAPRALGLLLALACLAYVPVDVQRIAHLRDQVHAASAADEQLRTLVAGPAGACIRAHGLALPDVRLRPFVAYWSGTGEARIGPDIQSDASLTAQDPIAAELLSKSLPDHPAPPAPNAWRLTGTCAQQ
jgi:hypothetical protein